MSSIFLSHSHKDKSFARSLGNDLRRFGARVWIDEAEIRVGDSLIRKIEQAIKEIDFLGVLLSPDSVDSEWVRREVEIALNDEILGRRVKVLPILVKKCEIPGFLKGKYYADFQHRRNWNDALLKVVQAIGLDELSPLRIPGHHLMVAGEFIEVLEKHFHPKKVRVRFFDDWSGVNFIRVENGDRSFQLYDLYTKPTHLELINVLFTSPGEARITDVRMRDSVIAEEAMSRKQKDITRQFGLGEESYPGQWFDQRGDSEECRNAWEEWLAWLDRQQLIAFVHEG